MTFKILCVPLPPRGPHVIHYVAQGHTMAWEDVCPMGVVSAGGAGLALMPLISMEECTLTELWLIAVLKAAATHTFTEITNVLQLQQQPNHQHSH